MSGYVKPPEDTAWAEPIGSMGSASTINTSIQHDSEPRPIGFVLPKEPEEVEWSEVALCGG